MCLLGSKETMLKISETMNQNACSLSCRCQVFRPRNGKLTNMLHNVKVTNIFHNVKVTKKISNKQVWIYCLVYYLLHTNRDDLSTKRILQK